MYFPYRHPSGSVPTLTLVVEESTLQKYTTLTTRPYLLATTPSDRLWDMYCYFPNTSTLNVGEKLASDIL